MKAKSTIWLCLPLFVVLATGLNAQTSLESTQETERKKLSVMLLVDGTVKATEEHPLPTRNLHQLIRTNKRSHQQKSDSFELSRELIAKEMVDELQEKLDHIFKASGLYDIDPAWCREVEENALEQGDVLIAENLSRNFGGKFNEVRFKVVKEQQVRLTDLATPHTQQDYLDVENKSPDLHKELMARSINMYSEPIFSENYDFLSKKIGDILKDARKQFNEQRKIVETSQGGGPEEITVDSIQKAVYRDIERYRASMQHPYNLFPSIQKSILPKSREIAFKKFSTWLDSFHDVVPDDRIREIIESDMLNHRKSSQSELILSERFLPEIQTKVIHDYSDGLSSNDRQRLKEFIGGQPSFYVQIELVVKKSLGNFTTIRDDISREQFSLYFPDLANNSWKLDEKAIQRRYNGDQIKDNKRIVQDFLSGKQVLEETDELVEGAVFRLAGHGDMAMKQQMILVRDYRKRVEGNFGLLFEGIADSEIDTDTAMNALVEIASMEIRQTWHGNALSDEYPLLFGGVKEQLRKEIKDLIPIEMKRREEIKSAEKKEVSEQQGLTQSKQQADQVKRQGLSGTKGRDNEGSSFKSDKRRESVSGSDGKSGTNTGTGTGYDGSSGEGAGKKGKRTSNVIIDIDIEGEKIVIVVVKIDDAVSFTFTFPLGRENNKKFRTLVTPETEIFEKRLKAYFAQKGLGGDVGVVYFITRVFHLRTPYGLVHDLRERARTVGAIGGHKKFRFYWYDGFFLQKEPLEWHDIKMASRLLLSSPRALK